MNLHIQTLSSLVMVIAEQSWLAHLFPRPASEMLLYRRGLPLVSSHRNLDLEISGIVITARRYMREPSVSVSCSRIVTASRDTSPSVWSLADRTRLFSRQSPARALALPLVLTRHQRSLEAFYAYYLYASPVFVGPTEVAVYS